MNIGLLLSTKEAAEKLGLSQDHVKLLARNGHISAKKIGRDWVITELNYRRKRQPKSYSRGKPRP
jgi:excisionase family DNA binding protein